MQSLLPPIQFSRPTLKRSGQPVFLLLNPDGVISKHSQNIKQISGNDTQQEE